MKFYEKVTGLEANGTLFTFSQDRSTPTQNIDARRGDDSQILTDKMLR